MAAGLQDGTVLVFSIATDNGVTESYGLVQSATVNGTTERAEAKGTDGNTVSIQEYDEKKELTLNYLELGTPLSTPAIGTEFTYDTVKYLINSINASYNVDGFKSVDVTATHYPMINV